MAGTVGLTRMTTEIRVLLLISSRARNSIGGIATWALLTSYIADRATIATSDSSSIMSERDDLAGVEGWRARVMVAEVFVVLNVGPHGFFGR